MVVFVGGQKKSGRGGFKAGFHCIYLHEWNYSNNKRPQYIFVPDFWMFVEDNFKISEIH